MLRPWLKLVYSNQHATDAVYRHSPENTLKYSFKNVFVFVFPECVRVYIQSVLYYTETLRSLWNKSIRSNTARPFCLCLSESSILQPDSVLSQSQLGLLMRKRNNITHSSTSTAWPMTRALTEIKHTSFWQTMTDMEYIFFRSFFSDELKTKVSQRETINRRNIPYYTYFVHRSAIMSVQKK